MKLASVNVSRPTEIRDGKDLVRTAIFKQPVTGPVAVGKCNLDGDGQADLENHGGEHKAVYAYSFDHYPYFREALGRGEMPFGQFGENLTVAGLDEARSYVGDHLRIGSAEFAITQPRVPCFKLGLRFGDAKVPRLFSRSLRTGYYLKVLREGVLQAGDDVEVTQRGHGEVRIDQLYEALIRPKGKDVTAVLARALEVAELSPEWRVAIHERLGSSRTAGTRP
ncbi:MAG: MOSC domain-containing protein [Betaproteobacteria bacterium]|nr:MOSC domain-containing protein [Betaproteobacteria bacterium]